jgi:hypothetical protein
MGSGCGGGLGGGGRGLGVGRGIGEGGIGSGDGTGIGGEGIGDGGNGSVRGEAETMRPDIITRYVTTTNAVMATERPTLTHRFSPPNVSLLRTFALIAFILHLYSQL